MSTRLRWFYKQDLLKRKTTQKRNGQRMNRLFREEKFSLANKPCGKFLGLIHNQRKENSIFFLIFINDEECAKEVKKRSFVSKVACKSHRRVIKPIQMPR